MQLEVGSGSALFLDGQKSSGHEPALTVKFFPVEEI